MNAQRKDNGFIPVGEALKKSGISRATLYRLMRPRRRGKKIEPPRVRSKNDWRGRRLAHWRDLSAQMQSDRTRPLSPR